MSNQYFEHKRSAALHAYLFMYIMSMCVCVLVVILLQGEGGGGGSGQHGNMHGGIRYCSYQFLNKFFKASISSNNPFIVKNFRFIRITHINLNV